MKTKTAARSETASARSRAASSQLRVVPEKEMPWPKDSAPGYSRQAVKMSESLKGSSMMSYECDHPAELEEDLTS